MTTMQDEETPVFATGGQAAARRNAQEKRQKEEARKNAFRPYEFLTLAAPKDGELQGESITLRLITDEPDLIDVKQHDYVPTKPAPADMPEGKTWRPYANAVCRYTLVPKSFSDDGDPIMQPWYKDCYIHDHIKVTRTSNKGETYEATPNAAPKLWGIAVEREEVLGTQEMLDAGQIEDWEVGSPVSYRDKLVEHVVDGKTVQSPRYLVLNFGYKNFWDKFLGNHAVHKTLVDRDYKVTRVGAGTATDYNVVALEPVTEELDGKSVKFDLRRPEFKARYEVPFSLAKLVASQASDEHYNWYFNRDVESSWTERYGKRDEESKDSGASPSSNVSTSKPGTDEDHEARLRAVREKLKESKSANNR